MSTRAVTLEIADDGTLTIPGDLVRMLRLSPRQAVTIEAREHSLVVVPSRKDRLERISHLLRTALAGVQWLEIETGRRDRWF